MWNLQLPRIQPQFSLKSFQQHQMCNVYSCSLFRYKIQFISFFNQNNFQKIIIQFHFLLLVDQGLLKYDEKVAKYWPEFAQNGKENITLEQVLRHEGGLARIKPEITRNMFQRESIKQNVIGEIIEKQSPKWGKKSTREYHAGTRGYILNEIVRRVDPQQRTIGEILKQEFTDKIDADIYIGVPKEKMKQCVDLIFSISTNPLWAYAHSIWPNRFGAKVIVNPFIQMILHYWTNLTKKIDFNSESLRTGEAPSFNGQGSARGLAKLGNLLVQNGKLNGKQFISQKTLDEFHSEPIQKFDNMTRSITNFNKGGNCLYDENHNNRASFDKDGFVGWQGMGGSVMNWQPKKQIAFSYVPNLMDTDMQNVKGFRLRAQLVKIINDLEKKQ
ncbi:Beta-lactamase/transpeptidase-like protein [Pseudocohnilembus persalinus]|uniref:Beta-lactamase/transpeptidase-like protein n=1 Tax=Pseudocohnilembus persalinus TaxID=266149 RepID=A0A0V0R6R7_PSEPJ|nr:Beta-lactamase/transpeptidase-like protein [Pseudocohnilembus persalinus]|eukprot:KRX10172.1 Beta-lactamase/transpeptidase-like protein [Pseudocohnilembus persalinus]